MSNEKLQAYKIVSHQFLTLLRIEFIAQGNHTPLGMVVEGFQSRNIHIRFISSDLSTAGTVTLNIGVDLLSEEDKWEMLHELRTLQNRQEVALISQVSMAMIYGPHFGEMPGIAGAALSSLGQTGIVPLAASASASSLSDLFPSTQYKDAMEVLTAVFQPPEVVTYWED